MLTNIEVLQEKIRQELPDTRRTSHGHILHDYSAIIIIAFLSILCGITTYVGMELFGKNKESWLKKFINLDNGIPDSDTIRRALERTDHTLLANCLYNWLGVFGYTVSILHIDGKTIRGSGNYMTRPVHVLSAFCSDFQCTLADMTVPGKNNEITVAKEFLTELDLKDVTVTGDAAFCQRENCNIIVAKGGNYCFAVKENQPTLLKNIKLTLNWDEDAQTDSITEKGHGRIETRDYKFTTHIDGVDPENKWCGMVAVGSVTRTVDERGEIKKDIRYFIISNDNFEQFKAATRKHWSVENNLHWELDVTFEEDQCRAKKGFAPLNLNVLRKVSLKIATDAQKAAGTRVSKKNLTRVLNSNVIALENVLACKSIECFV